MVEHKITENELILFLTCNRENLDIYTNEYFNQFGIQFNISIIKKVDEEEKVVKKVDGEEPNIVMPYKFFYDKMDYLKKVTGFFFKKQDPDPEESNKEQTSKEESNKSKSSTLYDTFEKGMNIFKADPVFKEKKPEIFSIHPLEITDKKVESSSDENNNGILSIHPLKLDTNKEDIIKEEYEKEEEIEEEIEKKVDDILSVHPVEIDTFKKEEPSIIDKDTKDNNEKIKIVISLEGEQVIKIEKSKLYKIKRLIPFIKYLLKNKIRWDKIDGFIIGEKQFVIGDYKETCIETSSIFNGIEIENTELYKLIKESECIEK